MGTASTFCECIWLWLVSHGRKAGPGQEAQGQVTGLSRQRHPRLLWSPKDREEALGPAPLPRLPAVVGFHAHRLPGVEAPSEPADALVARVSTCIFRNTQPGDRAPLLSLPEGART